MKNKYKVIWGLMILPFIVTGIFLAFMPDQVPMHYNLSGQIDRIGSKYENLIFPLLTDVMGAFFLYIIKYLNKKAKLTMCIEVICLLIPKINMIIVLTLIENIISYLMTAKEKVNS